MAATFYSQADQDIYQSGNRFIPQEQYRLGPYTLPAIMGQNTNAGITATGAANPYKWPWPIPTGDGGAGDISGTQVTRRGLGLSPGALSGGLDEAKLPGFGNWAKRTLGGVQDLYSNLPLPSNLLRKGIRRWRENRDIKRAEEQQAIMDKVSQQSQANAAAAAAGGGGGEPQSGITASTTAAQAAGMGGGSRQATSAGSTNSGRTDSGWGWAQGGRIGYREGDPVIPEDENEDIYRFMQDQGIPFGERVEEVITDEQRAMVLDMLEKGMDMETIISITGVGQEDVMSLMQGITMAPDSEDQGLASLV